MWSENTFVTGFNELLAQFKVVKLNGDLYRLKPCEVVFTSYPIVLESVLSYPNKQGKSEPRLFKPNPYQLKIYLLKKSLLIVEVKLFIPSIGYPITLKTERTLITIPDKSTREFFRYADYT